MSSAFEGLPKTPNLKLNKPGYDNVADIEALNENADILDAEIQGIKNTFVKSVNGINAGDDGNVDLGIIPISQGGTGATTASDACKNLGAVQTVNGKEPDAGGNVNVEEYTHPNSGVTAGTYRSVTVNAQGHVTAGSNPTLAIANGGTGANNASEACNKLGLSLEYWNRYGSNFTPSDTSNRGWNSLGIFKSYYSLANKIKNQPTIYGQLLNIPIALNNEESMQIWIQQSSGDIYVRGGNQNIPINDTAFRKLSIDIAGTIIAFAGNNIPSGYLPCNGSAISRATYADLFAVIGTTYGSGDGSTTFNLPNLNNKFIQGSDTAGTVKSAGLPNITATENDNFFGQNKSTSGAMAFTNSPGYTAFGSSGLKMYAMILNFDASRSSSIYGNSNTVQPPALTMRYIIKY